MKPYNNTQNLHNTLQKTLNILREIESNYWGDDLSEDLSELVNEIEDILTTPDKSTDRLTTTVYDAFRAGILYSADKYTKVVSDHFIGSDVNMFLTMEASEIDDSSIDSYINDYLSDEST